MQDINHSALVTRYLSNVNVLLNITTDFILFQIVARPSHLLTRRASIPYTPRQPAAQGNWPQGLDSTSIWTYPSSAIILDHCIAFENYVPHSYSLLIPRFKPLIRPHHQHYCRTIQHSPLSTVFYGSIYWWFPAMTIGYLSSCSFPTCIQSITFFVPFASAKLGLTLT